MKAHPHPIEVPESQLVDLRSRLARARYPEPATDPEQGIAVATLRRLMRCWQEEYSFRSCEAALNRAGSSMAEVDGLDIHFLHVRSAHAHAQPLVISHGWPGSVLELLGVLQPLTDPERHGGTPDDAFHVVVPSLPGYGFSAKPTERGWGITRIANAWHELMIGLGYERYLAQGGDWGSMVSIELAQRHPTHCLGAHINFAPVKPPDEVLAAPTEEELQALLRAKSFRDTGIGYARLQSTKPQTLGYSLVDSPVGMAAWMLEKFEAWTDGPGFGKVSEQWLLDNLTLWWLTASGASAARLYWESFTQPALSEVRAPIGITAFPREVPCVSERWARSRFRNLLHYGRAEAGGHFAALEQPDVLVQEIRAFRKAITETMQ